MNHLGKESRTLIVLSGGESARFGGKDKGLYKVDGIPLVMRVVRSLEPLADSIVIQVAKGKSENYSKLLGKSATITEDAEPFKGPLSGLSAALNGVTTDLVILSPCDLPNAPVRLFELLLSKIDGLDAAIPILNGFPEPITAVYRTEKLRHAVDAELEDKRLRLSGILDHLDVVFISESEMKKNGIRTADLKSMNAP